MNVFNKVTLCSLKKNRTRTIVTIIGIILSAAMICAVTTFVSSMQNYAIQYIIYNNGDWHGAVYNAGYYDYTNISENEEIYDTLYGQLLGYAHVDSKNEFKPYVYVIGAGNNFFDRLPVHLISGRLPENSDEIIIPAHLLEDGKVEYSIGDVVTFSLGDRLLDGFQMGQNNPGYYFDGTDDAYITNEEVISVREERTYTVVGFYERPDFEEYTAPGYTLLTVADENIGEDARLDVYFKMKDAKNIYEFMEETGLVGSVNTDLLLYSGISRYSRFSKMLFSLAVIVMGLIMFGSVALIYNAFSISVSERTKQFGLLSSVGATKKQLKRMVLFEAFAVSVVGIPVGIFVGIAGIGVTLFVIGNKIADVISSSYDIPMRVCVSWEAVLVAVMVSLVTVLISAWIPSVRATRVSAICAIRQSEADVKTKNSIQKESKLIYRIFGLPGVLADRHYKRNKKRYRATVMSLFMSVVLFVSASAFTEYLMESVTGGLSAEKYDLWFGAYEYEPGGKTAEDVLDLFISDEYVTGAAYTKKVYFEGEAAKECLDDEFIGNSLAFGVSEDSENGYITGYIYFVNDEEFKRLLKKYRLDTSDYFNIEKPLCIALDGNVKFDAVKEKYVIHNVLKSPEGKIECVTSEKDDVTAELFYTLHYGKVITESPFYIPKSTPANLKLIYPEGMADYVLKADSSMADGLKHIYFYVTTDNHTASFENLRQLLNDNGLEAKNLVDYAKQEEMNRNLVLIIKVFAYGFIILISMIAAANVFNTISTNLGLRRREFAMLKSVGMTDKDFDKMMNYECLLYGLRSLIYGLPVSAVITYFIYRAVLNGYETDYHLPWGAITIAAVSVFLVVFVTMLYSMSRIKKDNPIDALKREAI